MNFEGLLISYISNRNKKEKETDFHNESKLSFAYERLGGVMLHSVMRIGRNVYCSTVKC